MQVFDQALEGGGAKNFNFQELAADLAQITFDYPFRSGRRQAAWGGRERGNGLQLLGTCAGLSG